ncbi:DUF6037 family protein [Clostridium sp. UBA871]|uniref:DUF6037 family protein n=1 Tax=Clostridium sp. UBA871 TaxID=1946380 RepID=UPI003216BE81
MGLYIKQGICNLNKICNQLQTNILLFNIVHNKLNANVIYFKDTLTFLIGLKDNNVGWLIPVNRYQNISMMIPNESFKIIKYNLDAIGQVSDGEKTYTKHTTEPFFQSFLNSMINLKFEESKIPTMTDIQNGIQKTKTNDKKYDDEGNKPYFKNWRRNGIREVSNKNLNKTYRTFGSDIMDICMKNNITSVWSINPTPNSFDFIDKDITLSRLNGGIKLNINE